MIITKKKSFEDILRMLGSYTNIFLVGCGECSTTAHTGGEKEILEMKQYLESHGKKVIGSAVPKAPCISAQIKSEFAKNIAWLKTAEAVLVMSCGLGVQSVKQNNRFGQDVFPALDTVAGVIMDGAGNFSEVCSNCSECVLDKTGGICPITRCPKGLLNGPCGGVNKGKCEVDKTRDCAWVLIYRELEKKNRLKEFKEIAAAKDYSKLVKPHNISFQLSAISGQQKLG